MKDKQRLLILIIGLLYPIFYKVMNKLYYYLILDLDFINLLPNFIRTHLLKNVFSLDAIFCIIMILITVPIYILIKKNNNTKMKGLKATHITFKGFIIAIVLALGAGGLSVLWQMAARYLMSDLSSVAESVKSFDNTFKSGNTMSSYFWSLLSIGILGPIIEEYIFRGILFSGINRYLGGILTAFVTGIYFGLWHGELIQIVYTAMLGIVFGLAYAATRNLWFPMIIHLINNLLSVLPPSLENNEFLLLAILTLKILAIIPMIFILIKMIKKSSIANYKIL